MKIVNRIIFFLIIFLAISGGVVKLMQMPKEMEFFMKAGLDKTGIMIFGIAHILGGVMMLWGKTRVIGALLVAAVFGVSTFFVFQAGKHLFVMVSAISVLLALYIALLGFSKKEI